MNISKRITVLVMVSLFGVAPTPLAAADQAQVSEVVITTPDGSMASVVLTLEEPTDVTDVDADLEPIV